MALTKPNRKRVEKRSPKNKKAPSVTNIGAAFAKSVEFATDVQAFLPQSEEVLHLPACLLR